MRVGSLIILGAIFVSAFAGRAAVLAAKAEPGPEAQTPSGEPSCIDGKFADELRARLAEAEKSALSDLEVDRRREVFLEHVNRRIGELERLNNGLSAMAKDAVVADASSAARIAGLYEGMEAQSASAILGAMDPKFAAGLLLSMKSDRASAILANLSPERAYAITVLMTDAS